MLQSISNIYHFPDKIILGQGIEKKLFGQVDLESHGQKDLLLCNLEVSSHLKLNLIES